MTLSQNPLDNKQGGRSRRGPQTSTGHQIPEQTQIPDPDQLRPGVGRDVGGSGPIKDRPQGHHKPSHPQMVQIKN